MSLQYLLNFMPLHLYMYAHSSLELIKFIQTLRSQSYKPTYRFAWTRWLSASNLRVQTFLSLQLFLLPSSCVFLSSEMQRSIVQIIFTFRLDRKWKAHYVSCCYMVLSNNKKCDLVNTTYIIMYWLARVVMSCWWRVAFYS